MSIKQKVNYKTAPLMYIVQPEYQDVRVHMQTLVVKKSKKQKETAKVAEVSQLKIEEKTSEQIIENEIKAPEVVTAQVTEPAVERATDEKAEESKEKQRPQRRTRKPISQMSIEEKVEFFTTLPKNMPRTLCQIETSNETYRGVIMNEVDRVVTIRTLTNAEPLDLPLDEIKAINLLGF